MIGMGLKKLKTGIREDEEADIGIGTLIIFIAIVLVSAIAASLMLYAAALLQQQAQKTVDDAVSDVSGGISVVNIAGDRNPDGEATSIVSGYMPPRDDQVPSGGVLWSVTCSADGVAPLNIVLNWTSAVDYGSGLSEEIVYRTEVYDPTNPAAFNEQVARNRLLTLEQLNPTYELVRLTPYPGQSAQYLDYSVRDDNSTSYAYAVVGVDRAGNRVLYSPVDSSASTDDATLDEDVAVPIGGSMTNTAAIDNYTLAVFWVPATDIGSGVLEQRLYRGESPIGSVPTQVLDGRTVLLIPNATLLAEFNSTTSSYVDAPPAPGSYYYFVVAQDRAGNQALLGSVTYSTASADMMPPTAASGVSARQAVQSVVLTWGEATDGETMIAKYLVFRSTAYSALDSVEELRSMEPLAEMDSDTFSYADYSGATGYLYYYTVIGVDLAGNYAQPVTPSNTIQMIEIKVETVPGSKPILFTSLMIEITDGETDVTLSFNPNILGPAGADAVSYSVEILRDINGVFATTHSLSDSGLVKIFIDAGEIGLNLHAQSSFSLKFIPTIGQPTLEECKIPYLGSYRYVTLV
jgi:archaellin